MKQLTQLQINYAPAFQVLHSSTPFPVEWSAGLRRPFGRRPIKPPRFVSTSMEKKFKVNWSLYSICSAYKKVVCSSLPCSIQPLLPQLGHMQISFLWHCKGVKDRVQPSIHAHKIDICIDMSCILAPFMQHGSGVVFIVISADPA